MVNVRVLLIVQDDKKRQRYQDLLAQYGVQVFVVSSFLDLSEDICQHTYHGIFLDIQTKMSAIRENRDYVYGLLEKFPVAQLKIDEKTGDVTSFYYNQQPGDTPLDFIKNRCQNFVPQKIRSDERKDLHLNVRLFKHPDERRPELTATRNISKGGCFIFSTRRWIEGSDVWIDIHELSDHTLILAQIRKVVSWGQSRHVPGIGVEFKKISESQSEELAQRFLS